MSDAMFEIVEAEVESNDVTLAFSTAYDLEASYDFGYVEVSTDGGTTWAEVAKFTGSGSWQNVSVNLATVLGEATSFQVRFRLTSDYSIGKDGWKIDDVTVFAPM